MRFGVLAILALVVVSNSAPVNVSQSATCGLGLAGPGAHVVWYLGDGYYYVKTAYNDIFSNGSSICKSIHAYATMPTPKTVKDWQTMINTDPAGTFWVGARQLAPSLEPDGPFTMVD